MFLVYKVDPEGKIAGKKYLHADDLSPTVCPYTPPVYTPVMVKGATGGDAGLKENVRNCGSWCPLFDLDFAKPDPNVSKPYVTLHCAGRKVVVKDMPIKPKETTKDLKSIKK